MSRLAPLARISAATLGAVALVVVGATAAAAHVGIKDATTAADGQTTVTFGFDHGCDGAATDAMEIELPEGARVVSAELPSGWALAESSTGASGSANVFAISGTPIPDGTAGGFAVVLEGYDTSVEHLVPIVQRCGDATELWLDTDPDAANPAARLAATTATPPSTTSTAAPETGATQDAAADIEVTSDFVAQSSHGHTPWAAIIGGAVVVVALVAGVVVMLRRRSAT